jgi:putative membrane protein insertion efficiency factor
MFFISPLSPPTCKFNPTCSQYAIDSIEEYGAIKGSILSIKRISKCHPWNKE